MSASELWPRLPGDGRRQPRERVGWPTWTLCGTLVGLVVIVSAGQDGPTASPPITALPSVAAGVSLQPSTVWVALSSHVYYHPDEPGFGTAFPGVFMSEMQAVARGCWPVARH